MSKRLLKERAELAKNPPDYCVNITLVNDDLLTWECTLRGPSGSPYDGGWFVVRFVFPAQYPFKAPTIRFVTPVYHPSILRSSGEVCDAVLGTPQWGPTLNVAHCLQVLISLLQAPNADHPLEDDIAQQLATQPAEFHKAAVKYTKEHAVPGKGK